MDKPQATPSEKLFAEIEKYWFDGSTTQMTDDYEIHVLEATHDAFSKVSRDAQIRMLSWLSERLADDFIKSKEPVDA